MRKHILPLLLALSLLFSTPSLLRIPRVIPFVHANIREAAHKSLEMLRSQGLWLVNVDLKRVERKNGEICFSWIHQYTSQSGFHEPESITTCIRSE